MALLEQLIVGCARDDLSFELRNRLIVDNSAERARSKDVRIER